jgi:DNA-binding response OmpR family regulator
MDVRRIAVLDNDRIYLEIIRDLLQDEGFAVVTHDDLSSGCGFLRQQRPDLVIVDILQQREPLGLVLLASLLQDVELRVLPVIVVSADEMTLREHAEQFQADGFAVLGKPFDVQELLRVIRRVLNLSAPLPTGTASAD